MQRNVNNVALSCDTCSEFKLMNIHPPRFFLLFFIPSSLPRARKKEKEERESTDVV